MLWSDIIDISWSDHKLQKTCASNKAGQRKWGADQWKLLQRRLASLLAAPTLKDMDGVPGRCHPLGADQGKAFHHGCLGRVPARLALTTTRCRLLADGGLDVTLVTRIVITEVVDYHGD